MQLYLSSLKSNTNLSGAVIILIGIVFLAVGGYLDTPTKSSHHETSCSPVHPYHCGFVNCCDEVTPSGWWRIFLCVMINGGMALIVAGVFEIMIGSKTWRDFFEQVLTSVYTDKEYLKRMGEKELLVIQAEIYKQRTKKDDIDREGSFYNFFNDELFKFLSAPYREDASSTITIQEENSHLIAVENLEYTYRRGSNGLQEIIKYEFEPGHSEYEELRECKVTVILPNGEQKEFNSHIRDDKQGIKTIQLSGDADLVDCDSLKIKIEAKAVLNRNSFQTWHMASPTRNVQLHLVAPEGYKVLCDAMVEKGKNYSIVHSVPHSFSISLKTWMLPQNGFVFRIIKN